jgi:hypothetical protein
MSETTSRERVPSADAHAVLEPGPEHAQPRTEQSEPERQGGRGGAVGRLIGGDPEARIQRLEIISSVLLAVTTMLIAWSAYQATRWSGVQTTAYARASTNRVESTRSFNLGAQKYSLDTNTFNAYAAAYSAGNDQLVSFYRNNVMRQEFLPFLDRWLASDPLNPQAGADVLRSPMEDPEYLDLLFLESRNLEALAEDFSAEAQEANRVRDDYVLGSVFFASVLFFGGISSKFRSLNVRVTLLGAGAVMLLFGVVQVVGLPIH